MCMYVRVCMCAFEESLMGFFCPVVDINSINASLNTKKTRLSIYISFRNK